MKTKRALWRTLVVAVGLSLAGCGVMRGDEPPPPETKGPHADELARVENDFARMSQSDGAVKAFDRYLAAECIDPSPSSPAAVGKTELLARLKKLDDAGFVLSWHPRRAETAASGDFGYTYGPWELRKKEGGEIVGKGYFATVWKKMEGEWKAFFDMGNESPLEGK